jgi:hypothetical protein
MYRPPTRRAFLSPGDALEVRTRVSVADCRDVAPDQLRYEKLQYCTVHFCCSLKLYLSPGFTYRLFPPASPLFSIPSHPLSILAPTPVFQYCTLRLPFLSRPINQRASSVLLAAFQLPCSAAFNCCRKGS